MAVACINGSIYWSMNLLRTSNLYHMYFIKNIKIANFDFLEEKTF